MRTIKFRGKRLDNFEWVYGDLLLNNGSSIIVIQVNRDYIGTTDVGAGKHWHIETPAYRVDINTTGQFTGLYDKNGKEIYEGDIGKVNHGDPFSPEILVFIVFENGSFGVYPLENQTDIFGNKYTGKMLCFSDGYKKDSFEVIGNIYENPELL